ncbi:MAG: aminotransferase class V-fold PLP-dependent enzyme, partial [Oscillospiraceae bacterium]|nr:aminotransferase class V-fold PLP-dependent enzyme [Oscillospiraceae bacterium]
MIYFDSAATTLQKPASVPTAVADAISHMTTPGRGDHPAARMAADLMLRCRMEAAALFDVPQPENVILTSNATHGLNTAIRSLVSPGDTVVISGYEHNAVTRPLHAIGNVSCRIVNGRLFDPEQMAEGFRKALDGRVRAAVCTHTSNVFGYTLPMDEIAAACREKGVPLIVDASQSAGTQPVSLQRWGAAYIAMPGHKGLYGPQGTG